MLDMHSQPDSVAPQVMQIIQAGASMPLMSTAKPFTALPAQAQSLPHARKTCTPP